MPNLAEFKLTIGFRYDALSGQMLRLFRFETLRQFCAFRYRIDIERDLNREDREVTFKVLGITLPEVGLATTGPAVAEFVDPVLPGTYRIAVVGAKDQVDFSIRVMPKKIVLLSEPKPARLLVEISEEIEVIG